MKACSLCAEPLADAAASCPRCGLAAPAPEPSRRPSRARRLAAVASMGVVIGVLSLPVTRAVRENGCEPRSWIDWHLAMKRACLTPSYVCENMTAAKMLEDPAVAEAYADALRAGQSAGLAHLDALVGHMRAAYGCEGAVETAPGALPSAPRALPPGHPRLPPGHPPVQGGPSAPIFQPPDVLTI